MRLGDQDLWNIYFNKNPEKLYDLNCTWNYREAFCNEVTSYYLFCLDKTFVWSIADLEFLNSISNVGTFKC